MLTISERVEDGLIRFEGWRVAEDHADGSLTLTDPEEGIPVRVWPANGGTTAQADRIRQLEAEVAELRRFISDLR